MILWVGGKNCIVKNEKCIVFPESQYVNSNPAKHLNFCLSGQKIIPKNHTKYLGVIIDEHLTFKEHVAQLRQKLIEQMV